MPMTEVGRLFVAYQYRDFITANLVYLPTNTFRTPVVVQKLSVSQCKAFRVIVSNLLRRCQFRDIHVMVILWGGPNNSNRLKLFNRVLPPVGEVACIHGPAHNFIFNCSLSNAVGQLDQIASVVVNIDPL